MPPSISSASNSAKAASSTKPRKSKTQTSVRKLVLRVRAVMGDRGFRSVSALQRSLAAVGVAISVPQLIRVVDGDAKHLNKDVIEGLLTVFDCGIGDLFAVA
jgi:hypothetical protein